MPETAALDSALSTLVLALPLAALLVLLVLLFRPRRQPERAISLPEEPPSAPEDVALPRAAVADLGADHASAPPEPLPTPEHVTAPAQPAPAATPSSEEASAEDDMIRHIGPIPDPKSPEELEDDIRLAERAGNHALLARLCLDLAQTEPADQRVPELLRKCVRSAMRSKSFAIHAAARLELADRARVAGDLTTACEHWQIARGLFFDMNDRELHKTAEGLMLRHGCPTDWVLTDF